MVWERQLWCGSGGCEFSLVRRSAAAAAAAGGWGLGLVVVGFQAAVVVWKRRVRIQFGTKVSCCSCCCWGLGARASCCRFSTDTAMTHYKQEL